MNDVMVYQKIDSSKIYKILHGNMANRGFQYKVGHNKMLGDFFPEFGSDGGLYCYQGDTFLSYLYDYTDTEGAMLAEVTLPSTALYLAEGGLIKTEEFILKKPQPLADYLYEIDPMDVVKRNPANIRYFSNPSFEMQRYAVIVDTLYLAYIKNPHESLIQLANRIDAAKVDALRSPRPTQQSLCS